MIRPKVEVYDEDDEEVRDWTDCDTCSERPACPLAMLLDESDLQVSVQNCDGWWVKP